MTAVRQQGQGAYRKGTNRSGGGGHKGAGGKKGRPETGWEKGDLVRDVDDRFTPYQVPAKPGRKGLYEKSPEEKAPKKARRLGPRPLAITILAGHGLRIPSKLRDEIRREVRARLSKIKEAQSVIVNFEEIEDGDIGKICTIKVHLKHLKHAEVLFGSRDLEFSFIEALKMLLTEINSSLKAPRNKARNAKRPFPTSRHFRPARILGRIPQSS